jgi:hypothetical protein
MKGLCPNIPANTPAMPLDEAHFGGFFVPGAQVDESERCLATLPYIRAASIVWGNKTRQGYALLSILKPAGYLFLASATLLLPVFLSGVPLFPQKCREGES